jgi:ATPase family protein associated with various cellular activities (AAA)
LDELRLPEHLEILLSDEPLFDVFFHGPWRVPDGLPADLRGRVDAFCDDPRVADLVAERKTLVEVVHAQWRFLVGVAALRGGSVNRFDSEVFGPLYGNKVGDRDTPTGWALSAGSWRPPLGWTFEKEGADRAGLLVLLRDALDLFADVPPVQVRRQALSDLYDRRRRDPLASLADLRLPRDRLAALWSEEAPDDVVAVLPELTGPIGYVNWICAGFVAAHERLAGRLVRSPGLVQMLSRLLRQADVEVPAALAITLGTATADAVRREVAALSAFDDKARAAWMREIRDWLARGALHGEVEACRAWLDMAMRLTCAVRGLPGEPYEVTSTWLPIRGFQTDLRALFAGRRVVNPLTERLGSGPGSGSGGSAGTAASTTPGEDAGAAGTGAGTGNGSGNGSGGTGGHGAGEPGVVVQGDPPRDPLAELNASVGLVSVRSTIEQIVTEVKAEQLRREAGIEMRSPTRHMVFVGDPGTGKSRVARLLARLYRDLGVLSGGHLLEVTRADLVGEYAADAGTRVRRAVERGMGGILVVDDVHLLDPRARPATTRWSRPSRPCWTTIARSATPLPPTTTAAATSWSCWPARRRRSPTSSTATGRWPPTSPAPSASPASRPTS